VPYTEEVLQEQEMVANLSWFCKGAARRKSNIIKRTFNVEENDVTPPKKCYGGLLKPNLTIPAAVSKPPDNGVLT
jgi:hypothetical protein